MAQKPYLPRATMSTCIMVSCPLPSTALFEIIHPHSTALFEIIHPHSTALLEYSASKK